MLRCHLAHVRRSNDVLTIIVITRVQILGMNLVFITFVATIHVCKMFPSHDFEQGVGDTEEPLLSRFRYIYQFSPTCCLLSVVLKLVYCHTFVILCKASQANCQASPLLFFIHRIALQL